LLPTEDLVKLHLPTVGQAPVRHAVQNFAGVMGFAVAAERHPTARGPVGLDCGAEPIPARERPIGERLPQLLRCGRDVGDVDEFQLAHFFASRPRLSSASALRRWRSYLPIQRSAMSWIGTGLR